jgi:cysteine desulfuration protein SufE
VSLTERQDQIVAELNALTDWKERYRAIIARGRAMQPFPEEKRDDKHLVKGCQSRVWLHAELQNGHLLLHGDSDAEIVRGLVAIVLDVFQGATPEEAVTAPVDFVDRLGLSENLSQTRANGLMAMIRQIRLYGTVYRALTATSPAKA